MNYRHAHTCGGCGKAAECEKAKCVAPTEERFPCQFCGSKDCEVTLTQGDAEDISKTKFPDPVGQKCQRCNLAITPTSGGMVCEDKGRWMFTHMSPDQCEYLTRAVREIMRKPDRFLKIDEPPK